MAVFLVTFTAFLFGCAALATAQYLGGKPLQRGCGQSADAPCRRMKTCTLPCPRRQERGQP